MKSQSLAIACLFLGMIIGGHELGANSSVLHVDTLVNQQTGQIMERSRRRGFNPVMVLAALTGIGMGGSALNEQRFPAVITKTHYSPERLSNAPITQIQYTQPTAQKKQAKDNRNLVEAIASYGKSELFAAVTGAGKTTLLNAAIKQVLEQENGNVNFLVIDPKSSKWCINNETFEDGQESVLYVKRDNAQVLVDRLKWIADDYLEARQRVRLGSDNYNPPKTVIIIDEFLVLQTKIKRSLGSPAIQQINDLVAEIIVMGREDNVTVWLVAQTHQCTKIGMSDGIRNNVGIIGLASPTNTASVEAMATDHYLFKAEGDRQTISQAIEKFKGSYFYVSNLKAHIEIAPTPKPRNTLTQDTDPWDGANTNDRGIGIKEQSNEI